MNTGVLRNKKLNMVRYTICACILLGSFIGITECRDESEPSKSRTEKLTFAEKTKTLYVGDIITIGIEIEPKEAKQYDEITYQTTNGSVIEIKKESGNNGVVIEGLKRGQAVITAYANGVKSYCEVIVLGGDNSGIPHIVVENYVFECRENEKRTITATLAGGTPLDNSGFMWTYSDQRVINLQTADNVAVFDTLKLGSSVITASHPKAQYSVDILIYVLGNNEIPVYITSEYNVIQLNVTQSNYQFAVSLNGGGESDFSGFTMQVTNGSDVIGLVSNNNIGTVDPKKNGTAKIRISHAKAQYPLDIVVIVYEEVVYKYIDLNKTLVILEENEEDLIIADFVGDVPRDYGEKFIFEIEDAAVVAVHQSYNQFAIKGLTRGKSVITIKNEYSDFDKEVLVIVNGISGIIDNEVYINTNQNVISTEVGANDVLLTMTLVGGNEADKNNFVWTVDDGTVIEVNSAHGRVNYTNRAISTIDDKFEAQALIKPKKVGTARITLENPKAKNSISVIVKVYKRGVFEVIPVVLTGSSIYKINIGQKITARLSVAAGNERALNKLTWESGNAGVLGVEGTELTGVLEGKNNGITTVKVTGEDLKNPYEATVIVGDENYLKSIEYMYVLNPYISVIKGESVYFGIQCENMTNEQIENIEIINNDKNIIESFGYRKSVTVTGLELGEGELIIRSPGLVDISVKIRVEEYAVNPDKPFYLRSGKDIYGVVKGQTLNLSVDLVGAAAHNERDLMWSVENSSIASITENGKSCIVRGVNTGQTIITVKHAKSINPELNIVIYVVETDAELKSKVILYMKETSILMGLNEARYVSVITNADDAQKKALIWNINGTDVIDCKVSEDRVKAYIYAKNAGNAVITVSNVNVMVPAAVYISVINRTMMPRYIDVPSIVELVMGQTVTVNAVAENIDDSKITWTAGNNDIISAYGNGISCLVSPVGRGNTTLTVEHESEHFKKNILVYVYGSIAEMKENHLIASEQTRYVINKGDIININLVFGMRGYPEHEIVNIGWSCGAGNVVGVEGNGRTAKVTGKNTGVGTVTVMGKSNTITIEIEVRDDLYSAGGYWFKIKPEDKIKGMLAGSTAAVEVEVWNGNSRVYHITEIECENENGEVVSAEMNGLVLTVRAQAGKEGQSYITLKHNAVEDARILIYTAMTEFGLQNTYPLFIEKSNYLMQKGQSVDIAVQTADNNASKYGNIHYRLQNNNNVIRIAEKDKRTVAVEALNSGSDVILISYNTEIVQRVYVSVTESGYTYNGGYLVTESIIALSVGKERETVITTDYSNIIEWYTDNIYIASINRKENKKTVIRGVNPGQTTITIKAGDLIGYLKVLVFETEEEARNCAAINIEKRYYRIMKNESVTINVHSYNGAVQGRTVYADNNNYNPAYGGVLKINSEENHKLSVTGVKEGVAAIKVSNSFYGDVFVVYVEVYNGSNGVVNDADSRWYITAAQTMYVIDINRRDVAIYVAGVGNNFQGDSYWKWRNENSGIISMEYAGSMAIINPVQEGQAKIIVENPYCQNSPFEILVVVGDRYEIEKNNLPYIHLEKDIYEVNKEESIIIPYSLVNVAVINTPQISVTCNNLTVVSYTNNASKQELTVKGLKTGVARLVISYNNNALQREIYVLVKEKIPSGNVYLTTSENYIIMSEGEFRTVKTTLVGAQEYNVNNIKWEVDPPNGVAQVFGNGETGQIYALAASNTVAKVTVTYLPVPDFPLTIYVRVINDKTQVNMAYLTTQQNVIELVEGSAGEVINIQKVGNLTENSQIMWTEYSTDIINVDSKNDYATVIGMKAGMTKIKVYINGNSAVKLDIVVIVRPALGNSVYIKVDETLIIMNPKSAPKHITAVLEGGDPKDNVYFQWSLNSQSVYDSTAALNGGKVVSFLPNNEECVINALYEGIAQIQITNSKAERSLIITVYVTQHERIEFENPIRNMLCGEVSIVSLKLPTYENMAGKVVLTSSDTSRNIVEVYHTNTTVFLKANNKGVEGAVKLSAYIKGQEDKIAEMVVNVTKEDLPNTNKIIVDKQILNLSLKSSPVYINADVSGPNVTESVKNSIEWTVPEEQDVIEITPAIQTGRQKLVKAKKIGETTIMVHISAVDEGYWKTIKIIVSDIGNNFSLSPNNDSSVNNRTIKNKQPFPVTAEIVGGTTRDYNEIKWVVMPQQKWDGTMLEVVRLMGSGKQVLLYPMNDGLTKLIAYYEGKSYELEIIVENEYYFDFRAGTEYMYPGETREIEYEVRPASSNVTWVKSGMSDDSGGGPIVVFADVMGSGTVKDKTSVRKLFIEAKREGMDTIMGMASGRAAQLQIVVNYNYSLTMGRNNVKDGRIPMPKYVANGNDTITSDGKSTVDYWIYPPNAYIQCKTPLPAGLIMEIIPPDEEGHGLINFTGTLEIYQKLEFKICKPKIKPDDNPILATNNDEDAHTFITYRFTNLKPVFYYVKGDGEWSLLDGTNNSANCWILDKGVYNYNGIIYIGDGEQHYIVIRPNYDTAQMTLDNTPSAPSEMSYPSNVGDNYKSALSLDKTEIYANGAKQSAVRLSGGNDYIVYDRVMFDKNLMLYIQTDEKYLGTNGTSSDIDGQGVTLYENSYEVTRKLKIDATINGLWTEVTHPYAYSSGSNNPFAPDDDSANKQTFYLLKKSHIQIMENMGLNPEYKLIKENIWLSDIDVSSTEFAGYIYYLKKQEMTTIAYRFGYNPLLPGAFSLINALKRSGIDCIQIEVFAPLFKYNWDVYVAHKNTIYSNFRQGYPDTSHLTPDANNPTDGYVLSYAMVEPEIVYVYEDQDVMIYQYDKAKVESLQYNTNNSDEKNLQAAMVFPPNGNFKKGIFEDSMASQIPGYNATSKLYSSNVYEDYVFVISTNNTNVTSKYNLLTREVVQNRHGLLIQPLLPSQIKINNAISYKRNNLYSYNYDPHKNSWFANDGSIKIDSFYYTDHFKVSNVYDYAGGIDGLPTKKNNQGTCIIINTGANDETHIGGTKNINDSRTRLIKSVTAHSTGNSSGGVTGVTYTYEYEDVPNNRFGINIFGRGDTDAYNNDEDDHEIEWERKIKYESWSNYYRMSTPYERYNRWGTNSYYSFYTQAQARNKLEWEGISTSNSSDKDKPIIPYYYFNQYPFRYERDANYGTDTNADYSKDCQLIKYMDGGDNTARPMPSLNTGIVNGTGQEGDIELIYNTFSGEKLTIKIPITYQVRGCHMQYKLKDGGIDFNDKLHVNGKANNEGEEIVTEYRGPHSTSFNDLGTYLNGLNSGTDIRKTTYDNMKKFIVIE